MSDVAIRAEGLSKRFRIGELRKYKALRDTLAVGVYAPFRAAASLLKDRGSHNAGRSSNSFIWALKDVSFEIKRGEVVGIIGRNGAGKSTLLRILSRITQPTAGYAEVRGRVGSLLEVGTGFHSELTGRENIYLNGAILGMRKTEIKRKFDEIVAFAGVEKFIDTPVKHFSTGMYLRLAFAIAAHLDTEIILVDEVLAVGDVEFQRKCLGKMEDVSRQGRTVIFVSHSMDAIARLCDWAIWLDGGHIEKFGSVDVVISDYLLRGTVACAQWERPADDRCSGEIQIRSVRLVSDDGQLLHAVGFENICHVEIEYVIPNQVTGCELSVRIKNSRGITVLESYDSDNSNWHSGNRGPGRYRSICRIPARLLAPGDYFISVGSGLYNLVSLDQHQDVLRFTVLATGSLPLEGREGIIVPLLEWSSQPVG